MTALQEIIQVPLPAGVTEDGVLRYFESRRSADGTISLPLHVPLSDFGIPTELGVEHRVQLQVRRQRDAQNLNDEIAIAWKPEKDGLFPSFQGRIIVWSEDRPDESFVELRGWYEPPLGNTGLLFDAAAGNLIAHRTARSLLLDLREGIVTPC